ncbi:hypothetical protein MNBD_GAMMA22-2076 [hydrothermal vent metagenome]|uniref:Restriction endonuclease n=1 Tax=hydrothermal vent metagenome TaxID=652676 RepID=A0A3B1AQN0_9ZZZZ
MLVIENISCPYCGENFETQIDCSIETQHYIEDCYVCCQPIVFNVSADCAGNLLNVSTEQDND